jgi:hypothetical protein
MRSPLDRLNYGNNISFDVWRAHYWEKGETGIEKVDEERRKRKAKNICTAFKQCCGCGCGSRKKYKCGCGSGCGCGFMLLLNYGEPSNSINL